MATFNYLSLGNSVKHIIVRHAHRLTDTFMTQYDVFITDGRTCQCRKYDMSYLELRGLLGSGPA